MSLITYPSVAILTDSVPVGAGTHYHPEANSITRNVPPHSSAGTYNRYDLNTHAVTAVTLALPTSFTVNILSAAKFIPLPGLETGLWMGSELLGTGKVLQYSLTTGQVIAEDILLPILNPSFASALASHASPFALKGCCPGRLVVANETVDTVFMVAGDGDAGADIAFVNLAASIYGGIYSIGKGALSFIPLRTFLRDPRAYLGEWWALKENPGHPDTLMSIVFDGNGIASASEVWAITNSDVDTALGFTATGSRRAQVFPTEGKILCSGLTGGAGSPLGFAWVDALTREVLWRATIAGLHPADFSRAFETRGRYLGLGSRSSSSSYDTAVVLDLWTGVVIDSGDFAQSESSSTSVWDSRTGRLTYLGSASVQEYSFSLYDAGGLPDGSQAFDLPITGLDGFRGVRLERSNVTGVLNSYFENLGVALTQYQDGTGDALPQQEVDMNNQRIINLGVAVEGPELLTKAQAEAMA